MQQYTEMTHAPTHDLLHIMDFYSLDAIPNSSKLLFSYIPGVTSLGCEYTILIRFIEAEIPLVLSSTVSER